MIKEFAIQPEVMATWSHFRELRADFDVGQGRLICRFPKSWTRDVCELVDRNIAPEKEFGDIRASSIKNFVTAEKHRFIPSRGRIYEPPPKKSWLQNAEDSTSPEPFHAVIAAENPRKADKVLVAGEFDRSRPPFAVAHQNEVLRNPDDLADCCSNLLDVCEEIILIDPYFSPATSRCGDTFRSMLTHAKRRPRNIRRIEIHAGRPEEWDEKKLIRVFEQAFADELPVGAQLRVVYWNDTPEGLHARYLLTDLGGVKFDWGFDKGALHTHLNEIILIEHRRWIELYNRYSSPPNGCVQITVKGTR